MSDRLAELRRQRALVQQHLAWLDAEIAAAEKFPAPAVASAPASAATAGVGEAPAIPPADTEALLARYAEEERTKPGQVKLGCWIAFLILFAGFWGAVGVWYFLKTRS